mmetsp:Transcript_399/g.861  ORF Transcript_399/g.861 Transcript_399/m.861 type:complete len:96 (+) Transcript_399:970-1257(+)
MVRKRRVENDFRIPVALENELSNDFRSMDHCTQHKCGGNDLNAASNLSSGGESLENVQTRLVDTEDPEDLVWFYEGIPEQGLCSDLLLPSIPNEM